MSVIIGRKKEIEELEKLYHSDRSEFVAVYGRRRVGKTFLINQVFKNRFTFQHTGVSPVDQESEKNLMRTQLESFYYTLLSHGLEGYDKPKTWMEAFFQLKQLLQFQVYQMVQILQTMHLHYYLLLLNLFFLQQ